MSFFSDLFQGNFSNLGNDISPSNIFSDTASSFANQPGWAQGLEIGGAALLGGAALPEILPAFAATDVAGATAGFGAASDAFDITGGLGPGLAGTAFDTAGGVPLAGLDPSLIGTTGDAVLPAASTPTAGAFSGAGTALDMGGGGTLDPATAAAQGFPAGGGAGAVTPAADAASAVQPLTSFEGGIPSPANPGVGGQFGFGAAPAAASGNPLTDTLSGIGTFLKSPAGTGATAAVGAGALGVNLYEGYQQKKALDAANQQQQQNIQQAQNAQAAAMSSVAPLLNNGTMLTTYLSNNTLPPQFQSQIDQWVQATKAQVTQGYASRGQSSDPNQNSALQQDLANVDQQALGLKGNFETMLATAGQQMITTANSLISTGLSATQLASEIPIAVSKLNQSLNLQMSQAISNFAAALNGGNRQGQPGTLSINLNPQTGALQ